MKTPQQLQEEIERLAGRGISLKFNRNRRTVLSHRQGILSMHEAFLTAPQEVLAGVAAWVKGAERREHRRAVRQFINETFKAKPRAINILTAGKIYDLKEIFNLINRDYFENQVDAKITWYQLPLRRWRRSLTFGTYCPERQLVRINALLDDPRVIRPFVEFVVYHEMLHHVVAPERDRAGRLRFHTAQFRLRERQFRGFTRIKEWESKNLARMTDGWA